MLGQTLCVNAQGPLDQLRERHILLRVFFPSSSCWWLSSVVVVVGSIIVFLRWLSRFSYLYVDTIGVCVAVVVGDVGVGVVVADVVFAILTLFLLLFFR